MFDIIELIKGPTRTVTSSPGADYVGVDIANYTQTCVQCGSIFIAAHADRKLCSKKCRDRARVYVSARKAELYCQDCGANIRHRHWTAKYCVPCAAKRRKASWHAWDDRRRPMVEQCTGCGKPFPAPQVLQFCSRSCNAKRGRASQTLPEPVTRACVACGGSFSTNHPRRTACGRTCLAWAYLHPGVVRVLDRECLHCLTPFRAKTAKRRFCSPGCSQASGRSRREKRLNGVFIEEVSKTVVADRDKWTCQLCNKRVLKKLSYPHPMSWSLDHVVPISLGGEHSYANAQLAHLVCNIRKGNRISEPVQLALVG